jgi:hypothetical protein
MRLSNYNNIWAAGQNGLVAHFNGKSLCEYTILKKPYDNYYSISINKNKIITVGYRYNSGFYSQAIITMGNKL